MKGIIFSLAVIAAIGSWYLLKPDAEATDTVQQEMMPPPPEVDVMTVGQSNLRIWTSFSGRLAAVERADIKPLVAGRIEQVLFKDGDLVLKDAPLFLIDPKPFQAKVKRIEAQLVSARSRHKLAEQELKRARGLVGKKLVSQSVFEQAQVDYEVAVAAISEAKNALDEAKIDLDYATIRAPFDGKISRAELTVGNVVEVNTGAPVLATLVSQHQVYAEFNVDESRYIQAIRSGVSLDKMPVNLRLSGDMEVVYQGHLFAFDNEIDSSTGTIRARALFDNTDGVLKPGMYADIELGSAKELPVLMIPQTAIGTNQSKRYVLVVGEDMAAVYREVTLGRQSDGLREVLVGLQDGERIVTRGLAKIRPGMPVTISSVANES